MNHFLILLAYIVAMVGTGLFGFHVPQAEAADCTVTNAGWYTLMGSNPIGLRQHSDPSVEIKFDGTDCVGWKVSIEIDEVHGIDESVTPTPFQLNIGTSTVHIPLSPGEQYCDNDSAPDCAVEATLTFSKAGSSSFTYDVPGELIYDCKNINACNEQTKWALRPQAEKGVFSQKTLFAGDSDTFTNGCEVSDARFDPYNTNYTSANPPNIGLLITTKNCAYQQIMVSLMENDVTGNAFEPDGDPIPEFKDRRVAIPSGTDAQIRLNLISGNDPCPREAFGCGYWFKVVTPQEETIDSFDFSRGKLTYDQDAYKLTPKKWQTRTPLSTKVTPPVPVSAGQGCKILSAEFNPGLSKDEKYTSPQDQKIYDHYPNYMNDAGQPQQQITVKTEKCKGSPIYVSVVSRILGGVDVTPIPEFYNKEFIVPENEIVTITAAAGESRCAPVQEKADCFYHIMASAGKELDLGIGTIPESDSEDYFYSKDATQGNLYYNCDGSCDKPWNYETGTGETPGNNDNEVSLEDEESIVDTESACYDKEAKKLKEGCYELYGGLAELLSSRLDKADQKFKTLDQDSLGGLINAIIAIAIGAAGVLAVGMIMYQGFLYMKTDNVSTKTIVRVRIVKTTGGLILLLTIYTGLRTINPDLLNLTPLILPVTFNTGGDAVSIDSTTAAGQISSFKEFASTHNITCPGSGGSSAIPGIANSMKNKITYSMEKRGQVCSNDTFCWDCSGFVSAAYSCAGIASPGTTTTSIFTGAEAVTSMTSTQVNNVNLVPGDLLGWIPGSVSNNKKEENGHVVMYIGNGMAIESTSANGGKKPGKALQVKAADALYKAGRIKFIRRVGGGSVPVNGTNYGASVESPE